MNKIIVKIILPRIDKQYDVWVPINKKLYTVILLLIKGINELNDGIYKEEENTPILYNRATGEYYDFNMTIQDTNIKNGTELILI